MSQLRTLPLIFAFGVGLVSACPATALDGLAGPYLAGRLASQQADYAAAADYFSRALIADPTNHAILEDAIISQIGLGAVDKAVTIANALDKLGDKSQIADLVVLSDLAKKGDYAAALAALDTGRTAGPLVDELYRAWAMLGLGQMSEASEAFDAVSAQAGLKAFGLYHKALALASVGDFEGADRILSGEADGPLRATRRGIIAHAQILSQLERNDAAIELIDKTVNTNTDPLFAQMRADLAAGKVLPFTAITSVRDGMAEVFFTVSSALSGEGNDLNTLAYARMSQYLRPDQADTLLLCAAILEAQGQHDLAVRTLDQISPDDPAYVNAELARSDTLLAAGRVDDAIDTLKKLAKRAPDRVDVWTTLGDVFRRQERFGEAVAAYDKAIALFTEPESNQWAVYYTRGIANEREKNWPAAEADFREALVLRPDQPQVLNYLGYSYLEKNINLDEALAMIERAVAVQPNSGAIVDSLGWGLYRLGRYDDSVVQMEKAVELMPLDPVVNDHLGDVYWAVGRKREAEFQWRRALSFKPETEEEAQRIRRKLEVGLDAVLSEEGAKPLALTKNGN
ncbi:MAG: tetratricopeptide repeat protein [Rhodobacteraceae bacterium]|nr:tetratricopeptide repeat protein [Paracoccaceae bacterium]MCP5342426.1 tetratricopeptide repeat protein [Paracoccaceae bacterium]